MNLATPDPASFRDPSGRVFHAPGRILRCVMPEGLPDYESTRRSGVLQALASQGRVIPEKVVGRNVSEDPFRGAALLLEHPSLPLITYPYEWSFAQLQAAALHHLDLQIELLDSGISLCDGSAYNVQFLDATPVFIDALSFRPYVPGEPWQGYRQFCEQFLNPLLLRALRGVPHNAWFRGSPDGIPVVEFAALLRPRDVMRWQVLAHVVLHARFQRGAAAEAGAKEGEQSISRPLSPRAFREMLMQLRQFIAGLEPAKARHSPWADYSSRTPYSPREELAKRCEVSRFCADVRPATLCDIGCNAGGYTQLALESGAGRAVALDADDACIDALFTRARTAGLRVSAILCDIAAPSPDLGWAATERQGLLGRIRSEGLLALGLVHHLAIGRNLPLPDIIDLLLRIAPQGLVEFIPKSDPMCARLLAHRRDIFPGYTEEAFAAQLGARATIVSDIQVTATGRRIYRYRKG